MFAAVSSAIQRCEKGVRSHLSAIKRFIHTAQTTGLAAFMLRMMPSAGPLLPFPHHPTDSVTSLSVSTHLCQPVTAVSVNLAYYWLCL